MNTIKSLSSISRLGLVEVVCVVGVGRIVVCSILVVTRYFIRCGEWCREIYNWCCLECTIAMIAFGAMVYFSTPLVAMFLLVVFGMQFWIAHVCIGCFRFGYLILVCGASNLA